MPTVSAAKVAKGIPQKYFAYAKVFSEEKANKPLSKGTQEYAIELEEGKQPLYSPIYSLLETELVVLRKYL